MTDDVGVGSMVHIVASAEQTVELIEVQYRDSPACSGCAFVRAAQLVQRLRLRRTQNQQATPRKSSCVTWAELPGWMGTRKLTDDLNGASLHSGPNHHHLVVSNGTSNNNNNSHHHHNNNNNSISNNNNNNNKWNPSCNPLLQNQKSANHLSMNHNLQNHHHHHAVAALSSPFSSLLGAAAGGGAAGYLLDPLGGLNKTTAANHLF
uniref:Uncharacterized protein n=1 Tax=Anopheles culicifacies TaxID=139723 RepID=A0A182MB18_9DIPT